MNSILRQLPSECIPELDNMGKRLLLQKSTYTIPGGDSIETVKFTLDSLSANYLQCQSNFTTGQSGFNSYELRRFKTSQGSDMIIFSTYGGTRASFFQNDLRIFYLQNKNLIEDKKQNLLQRSVRIDDFLKKQTPDSIKILLEQAMSTSYFLTTERKNSIEFTLYPEYPVADYEKWIICYSYTYTWTGKKFIRKINNEK
ncbi:MAG: hypothetical protein ABIR78_05150 [Ferruginibacter sp.]